MQQLAAGRPASCIMRFARARGRLHHDSLARGPGFITMRLREVLKLSAAGFFAVEYESD